MHERLHRSTTPTLVVSEQVVFNHKRECCNPVSRHISGRYRQRLSQLFSLWRHWRHAQRYRRTYGHLTTLKPNSITL